MLYFAAFTAGAFTAFTATRTAKTRRRVLKGGLYALAAFGLLAAVTLLLR